MTKKLKQYINILTSYIYRNKYIKNNIDRYENIIVDKESWFIKYDVIAHSGGGIDGYKKTNSLQGWKYAYKHGTRVFDADLSFTSDGMIVLRHEWSDDLNQDNISEDNIPTYDIFMQTPILIKYQPMSLYNVINFMEKHDDIYVACDFKDGIEILIKLVSIFKDKNCLYLLDRIIISLYDYQDYYQAKKVYDFKNYALRQYEEIPHNYYELCEFCLKEKIPVCMVTRNYIKEQDNISILTKKGITIFVATVNDYDKYIKYKKKGIKGIVSDFLTQDDLNINN